MEAPASRPQGQVLGVGVPPGIDTLAFHRHTRCVRWPGRGKLVGCNGHRRSPEHRRPLGAGGPRHCRCVIVHEIRCRAGGFKPHDHRQEVVVDTDSRHRIFGGTAILCDDKDDRLADVIDLVLGQGKSRRGSDQGGVRNEERQVLPTGPSRSSCVQIPTRPGVSSASVTSMSTIRACACGLRTAVASGAVPRVARYSGRHRSPIAGLLRAA